MKVVEPLVLLPAPAWWVGKTKVCDKCKACIELEYGDTVQCIDIKRDGKTETVAIFDCPKCAKPQRIVKA